MHKQKGMDMEQANWKSGSADALLAEFFAQDDLKALAADAAAAISMMIYSTVVINHAYHCSLYRISSKIPFTIPIAEANASR